MRPFRTLNPVKFLFYILSLTSFLQSVQATILLCFYITKNIELEKMYFSSVYPQIILPGLYRLTDVSCARPLTKPGEKIQMSLQSDVRSPSKLSTFKIFSFSTTLSRRQSTFFVDYIVYVLSYVRNAFIVE